MDRKYKYIASIALVLLIIIPAVYFYTASEEKYRPLKEAPSQEWIDRLNKAHSETIGYAENKVLVVNSAGSSAPLVAVAATPVCVYRSGNEMIYNPLIVDDGDDDGLNRFMSLTDRDQVNLDTQEATKVTVDLASANWKSSDFIILFSDYANGLAVAPLASYYNIPMIYVNHSIGAVKPLVKKLGCEFAISVGDAPALSIPTMGISMGSPVSTTEFYLWALQSNSDSSNYLICTNPGDIDNTWGNSGYLPIRGISMVAAQIAAYRKAAIYFTDGFKQNEVGGPVTDLTTTIQMGANASVANNYSSAMKDGILNMSEKMEKYGGDLQFLAIVGDPVAVPYHYEYFEPSDPSTPTFSNTNFIASDYYFADIEGDEHQDIAYGRVMGRSLTDASLLCARSLGFSEYVASPFEKGNDVAQTFYDTMSGDWKKNAGVFVGTTKPTPMPGCLKHMKKEQYDVLHSGGYFVTGEEALKLNDITAAKVLDKMNYLVYFGHGDYDCWYSNRADNIDATFVASQKLKPGFAAVMACLTGRTDNMTLPMDMTISQAYIHAGLNGYIGSTRLAYGLFKLGDGEQGLLLDTDALYLVDQISAHLIEKKYTLGQLLMEGRNAFIDKYGIDPQNDFGGYVAVWEYECYGDPAWMPAPAG